MGRIAINSLNELTRVGSVLSKDFSEPSVFDLEELQTSGIKERIQEKNGFRDKTIASQKSIDEDSCESVAFDFDHSLSNIHVSHFWFIFISTITK